MNKELPFVSVVTPVYNGAAYLSECIESIINQDYHNWEYVIVNNCSTDSTLSIATSYANIDSRIRIIDNTEFVGVVENHNIAFKSISLVSKYCKLVSADDWLYPECISKMVLVAEKYPSIGIVGSYAILTDMVQYIGLPLECDFFPGREVGRLRLLGAGVLGAPTSVLYRSDIVREGETFFTRLAPNADIDTSLRLLQHCDFGFVHQILSFVRIHDNSVSSKLIGLNSFLVDQIEFLVRYGDWYLSSEESGVRLEILLTRYYAHLADCFIKLCDRDIWKYHNDRMLEIGLKIGHKRLAIAVMAKILDLVLNPKQSIEKLLRRMNRPSREAPGTRVAV